MKNRTIMLLVVSLLWFNSLLAQNQGSINYHFSFPNYYVQDTLPYNGVQMYKFIQVEDESFFYLDSVGFPMLPIQKLSFNVPYGAHDFTVSVSNTNLISTTVNRHIMPCQPDFETDSAIPNFTISPSYNFSGTIFSIHCEIVDSFIVAGERGVTVGIMPVNYNPQNGQLTILQSADIQINYTTDGVRNTNLIPECLSEYFSSVFVNFETPKVLSQETRYLIVTNPTLRNGIETFANYKRNIGYTVDIEVTDQTPTPGEILRIIQNRYDNSATRPNYVLLVGNHSLLPAYEGVANGEEKNEPLTDFFYSTLDGNDWIPDVFLGRFPASGNSDLQNMVNKTIYMEMNNHLYEKKAALFSGEESCSYMEDRFEDGHQKAIDAAFEPAGYNYTFRKQPNINTVKSDINSNQLFLLYSGHGNRLAWSGHSFYLDYDEISTCTPDIYPICFAFACKTGAWGYYPDNFALQMMRKERGGVAYVGSSVVTMTNSDYAIEKCIFDESFEQAKHLGVLFKEGMTKYLNRFWSVVNRRRTKRYMKSYNLLGDPSFLIGGRGCLSDLMLQNEHHLSRNDKISYSANGIIRNEATFVAESGSQTTLTATTSITLQPLVHIQRGARFSATIKDCERNSKKETGSKSSHNMAPSSDELIDYENLLNVQIYPNPASTTINITINTIEDGNVNVDVFDIKGTPIINKSIQMDCNQTSTVTIPIEGLPSGCYIVRVKQQTKSFIKTIIKP